jgi:hypothetical protein
MAREHMSEVNRTRWRVAVDIEFELAATDQEAAITRAEQLLEAGFGGLQLRDSTEVEVVMALPVSVDQQP